MNNFCCNPKTRYFIRRERIPICFFFVPLMHILYSFLSNVSLFQSSLPPFIYLHLRPHIRPFISTNIILLWYYIISSFYFHLIPDRPWGCILLLSLSFFCHTCIYIYIPQRSTEIPLKNNSTPISLVSH